MGVPRGENYFCPRCGFNGRFDDDVQKSHDTQCRKDDQAARELQRIRRQEANRKKAEKEAKVARKAAAKKKEDDKKKLANVESGKGGNKKVSKTKKQPRK